MNWVCNMKGETARHKGNEERYQLMCVLFVALTLFGCKEYNERNNYVSNDYDKVGSVSVEESPYEEVVEVVEDSNQATSSGLYEGVVQIHEPRNANEKRAMVVLETYFRQIENKQYYQAAQHLYDDVFKYLHQEVPEMTVAEIRQGMVEVYEELLEQIISNIKAMVPGVRKHSLVVSSIEECAREGNKIIMVAKTPIQFTGENVAFYSDPDILLLISLNNGKSWKIATFSEDTPFILGYKFENHTIKEVINDIAS